MHTLGLCRVSCAVVSVWNRASFLLRLQSTLPRAGLSALRAGKGAGRSPLKGPADACWERQTSDISFLLRLAPHIVIPFAEWRIHYSWARAAPWSLAVLWRLSHGLLSCSDRAFIISERSKGCRGKAVLPAILVHAKCAL